MMTDRVAVQIIAGRHAFTGSLEHSSIRVLDVLNNAGTEFLRIHVAVVCRGLGGTPIGEFAEITVPKSSIECVVLTEERHEAPLQRRYALVEKQSHAAFVLLAHHELRGEIMLGRTLDPIHLLNGAASNFFPVVSATLSSADPAIPCVNAKVAFINRTKVAALHVDQRTGAADLAGR
jgi:hypothetical protein